MATDEQKFNHLYNNLQKHHENFISFSFKLAGFFLIVIGWLATSKHAGDLFSKLPFLTIVAIVGILLSGLVSIIGGSRVQKFSKTMFDELKKLDYMPENYYSDRVIQKKTMALYQYSIGLLTIAVVILITVRDLYF